MAAVARTDSRLSRIEVFQVLCDEARVFGVDSLQRIALGWARQYHWWCLTAIRRYDRLALVPELSSEVRAYLRRIGAQGGRIGGPAAAARMTPAQRIARAVKANRAAQANRAKLYKNTS